MNADLHMQVFNQNAESTILLCRPLSTSIVLYLKTSFLSSSFDCVNSAVFYPDSTVTFIKSQYGNDVVFLQVNKDKTSDENYVSSIFLAPTVTILKQAWNDSVQQLCAPVVNMNNGMEFTLAEYKKLYSFVMNAASNNQLRE